MKNKIYLLLYYISFLLTLVIFFITTKQYDLIYNDMVFIITNIGIIMTIIFTILYWKKKAEFNSIFFPVSYLVFTVLIIIICLLFDNKVLVRHMHYNYYFIFILVDYILLNTYSLLCIKNKKKH